VTITQPAPLTASTSVTDVSCNGGNNGAITVTANGGTPGYAYTWSNGQTTTTISGLTAGTYTVVVRDNNGCTFSTSTTVNQPAALQVTTTPTAATCGRPNGSATATPSGGTASYTFSWSNGATTQNISGVLAGTYTVVVTDNKGCTKSATVTIPNTNGPSANPTVVNVTCTGKRDGSVTANATGGTGSYTYVWSPNAQGQTIVR
jgi:uncharacterized protein affecting Mg2+/Co2+ transport